MSVLEKPTTAIVAVQRTELSVSRSTPLAQRGLQTISKLDEVEILISKGQLQYDKHDYSAAAVYFRQALAFKPADIQMHLMLGNSLMRENAAPTTTYSPTEMNTLLEEAFKHLEIAAQGGLQDAQAQIGYMYRDGEGVVQDAVSAFVWLRSAAQDGHPCDQRIVGLMYEHGSGVEKDLEQAAYWYSQAAQQGGYFERSQMTELQLQISGTAGGCADPNFRPLRNLR